MFPLSCEGKSDLVMFAAFGNRNYAMADMLCDLYQCAVPADGDSTTTYNVGLVQGGISVNTIAQLSEKMYEYRSDTESCLAKVQSSFEETLEKAKKKELADISVETIGVRPCGGKIDKEKHEHDNTLCFYRGKAQRQDLRAAVRLDGLQNSDVLRHPVGVPRLV